MNYLRQRRINIVTLIDRRNKQLAVGSYCTDFPEKENP